MSNAVEDKKGTAVKDFSINRLDDRIKNKLWEAAKNENNPLILTILEKRDIPATLDDVRAWYIYEKAFAEESTNKGSEQNTSLPLTKPFTIPNIVGIHHGHTLELEKPIPEEMKNNSKFQSLYAEEIEKRETAIRLQYKKKFKKVPTEEELQTYLKDHRGNPDRPGVMRSARHSAAEKFRRDKNYKVQAKEWDKNELTKKYANIKDDPYAQQFQKHAAEATRLSRKLKKLKKKLKSKNKKKKISPEEFRAQANNIYLQNHKNFLKQFAKMFPEKAIYYAQTDPLMKEALDEMHWWNKAKRLAKKEQKKTTSKDETTSPPAKMPKIGSLTEVDDDNKRSNKFKKIKNIYDKIKKFQKQNNIKSNGKDISNPDEQIDQWNQNSIDEAGEQEISEGSSNEVSQSLKELTKMEDLSELGELGELSELSELAEVAELAELGGGTGGIVAFFATPPGWFVLAAIIILFIIILFVMIWMQINNTNNNGLTNKYTPVPCSDTPSATSQTFFDYASSIDQKYQVTVWLNDVQPQDMNKQSNSIPYYSQGLDAITKTYNELCRLNGHVNNTIKTNTFGKIFMGGDSTDGSNYYKIPPYGKYNISPYGTQTDTFATVVNFYFTTTTNVPKIPDNCSADFYTQTPFGTPSFLAYNIYHPDRCAPGQLEFLLDRGMAQMFLQRANDPNNPAKNPQLLTDFKNKVFSTGYLPTTDCATKKTWDECFDDMVAAYLNYLPSTTNTSGDNIAWLDSYDKSQFPGHFPDWVWSQCSQASLAEVLNAYKKPSNTQHTIGELEQYALSINVWDPQQGFLGPFEANWKKEAAHYGFQSDYKQYSITPQSLDTIIALAKKGNPIIVGAPGHYLVLWGGDNQNVYLLDSSAHDFTWAPNHQKYKMNKLNFLYGGLDTGAYANEYWNGVAIDITPNSSNSSSTTGTQP